MKSSYQHILVPLDGSKLAEKALPLAFKLAKKSKAKVTLLRIVTPPPITIQPSAHHHLSETAEYEAADYLQKMVNRQANESIDLQSKLLRGSAASSILYFIEKHNVDLLIISSHGRSGLSRFFLGSVAEAVLRQAPCSTLLLRANEATHMFCQKVAPDEDLESEFELDTEQPVSTLLLDETPSS